MKKQNDVNINLIDQEREELAKKEMLKVSGGKVCNCSEGDRTKTMATNIG